MVTLRVIEDWAFVRFETPFVDPRHSYPEMGWRRVVDKVHETGVWEVTEWHFGPEPPEDCGTLETAA